MPSEEWDAYESEAVDDPDDWKSESDEVKHRKVIGCNNL